MAEGVSYFAVESPYATRNARERIKVQQGDIVAALARGVAQDHPEYRYLVGQISGLQMALDIIEDVAGKER